MAWQWLLAVAILLAPQTVASAQPAWLESFEGPRTTWSHVPNRHGVRLVEHRRVREAKQAGDVGAEHFRIIGPPGFSSMLLQPIGKAPVLEDLRIDFRLKCDQPGVVPAVRVVFPRVTDTNAGQPLAAIVRGDSRAAGTSEWEELSIAQTTKLVRRHARTLSAKLGKTVDDREAYVDALVLIVPSNFRGTEVWVDEVRVEGIVEQLDANNGQSEALAGPATIRQVALSQRGLAIDDRLFYPRVASHHGEPLDLLRKLGFNAVAFTAPPSQKQLRQAAKLRLQVFCPPPASDVLEEEQSARAWDPVVAWVLADGSDAASLDTVAVELERVRRADRHLKRPVFAAPSSAWGAWSRMVDGLVVAAPLASEPLFAQATSDRFRQAMLLARPGAPAIAGVSATHSPEYMNQVALFAPAGTVTPWRSTNQVINAALATATSGARGVWVNSDTPLNDNRTSPERTRLALAMLNLRLMLIEPWLRDGVQVGRVGVVSRGESAAIFKHRQTRLIVPSPSASGAKRGPVRYVVSNVTEGAKAYELSPVAVRPIELLRLTGGTHVTAQSASSMILLTDDVQAAAEVRKRIASLTTRISAVQLALAVEELRHAESQVSPLVSKTSSGTPDGVQLAAVRRSISLAKQSQSAGGRQAAYAHATRALEIASAWYNRRLASVRAHGTLDSSPLAVQPATVIDHRRLLELLGPLKRGPNLLPGGDFEDHQSAASTGWRHVARESTAAVASVSFSDDQPAHSARSLRIECPADPSETAGRLAVQITSPEVALSAGQLVEITGLVRIESVSDQGVLRIEDSLGGEQLALSIDRPIAWQPFRLLRRSSDAGPVTVTFSARGPITAGIDAVMIRPIELPGAAKAAVFGAPAFQRK